jgi:tetratricopeptide (TPR) repeat protein
MKNEIDLVAAKVSEIQAKLKKLTVEEKKEQHQDIVKCYEEAMECELNDAKIFKLLGELMADHFNDKERAIEYFEKAISCENLNDEDAEVVADEIETATSEVETTLESTENQSQEEA